MTAKRNPELIEQLAARDALGMYQETLDDRQVDAILARRKGDSDYDRVFTETHQLTAALEDCQSEWVGDAELMAFAEEQSDGRVKAVRRKRLIQLFAVAATLTVFAVSWFGVLNPLSKDNSAGLSRYVSRIGELKTIELSDGSVITLNTNSQMLVDMNDDVRRVVLDYGEGYFEIAADPVRPFTVELAERSVTVLGTEFNLRRYNNGFNLVVLDGEVAVHRKDDKSLSGVPEFDLSEGRPKALNEPGKVVAGMRVEFDAVTATALVDRNLDAARIKGWRQGVLNFDGVSLAEIVKELNRYTGKPIILAADVDDSQLVFASYRSDRIDLALKGLEFSLPITVESGFEKTVIRSNKNSN